jgi:DNA-binding Lrp family transcriptional regulator
MIFIILIDMELLQVLNKNIPQRQKVFARFQRKSPGDLSKFLLQLIKKIKKDSMDIKMLNQYFIELYDMLYHYIIFDKAKITKKIVRLLEELALPLEYVGEHKWLESFKKIKKMKL